MGVGVQRQAPAALSPGKRAGSHFTEGWVGPRAGLNGSRLISHHHRDSIPDRPARSQSLYRLSCRGPHVQHEAAQIQKTGLWCTALICKATMQMQFVPSVIILSKCSY
jgi:hypothetical protein